MRTLGGRRGLLVNKNCGRIWDNCSSCRDLETIKLRFNNAKHQDVPGKTVQKLAVILTYATKILANIHGLQTQWSDGHPCHIAPQELASSWPHVGKTDFQTWYLLQMLGTLKISPLVPAPKQVHPAFRVLARCPLEAQLPNKLSSYRLDEELWKASWYYQSICRNTRVYLCLKSHNTAQSSVSCWQSWLRPDERYQDHPGLIGVLVELLVLVRRWTSNRWLDAPGQQRGSYCHPKISPFSK